MLAAAHMPCIQSEPATPCSLNMSRHGWMCIAGCVWSSRLPMELAAAAAAAAAASVVSSGRQAAHAGMHPAASVGHAAHETSLALAYKKRIIFRMLPGLLKALLKHGSLPLRPIVTVD